MPNYVVDVTDATGKKKKEKVQAISAEQARSILENRYPSIGAVTEAKAGIDIGEILESMLVSVSVKDKAVFSRQFAVMINAGVAIVRCLGVLGDQCPNPKLKKAILGLSADVQEGIPLSESMAKFPDSFDNLYVSMVEAGEVGGVLDDVLNRLAKLLEDMAKLNNQIKSAMTYPIAVGSLAVIVFFAMTIFLIPIFAAIFEDLGTELPMLTQVMLWISGVLRSWKVLIPISAIVIVTTVIRQYYKTEPGRLQIDALLLKAPLFGDLIQKNSVARFCRIFGTLTRSGVPIITSLEIVRQTAGNQVIANAVEAAQEEIQQGGMISVALDAEKVFPPLAIQMMSIGEETGELDGMMMKVADFFEDEVENTVKSMTSILEPAMMVVIAAMVGVILLSMYLPMFKVFETLG